MGWNGWWGRTANHVVAATPSLALQFPPSKTTVVHNYPIIDEFDAGFGFEDYVAHGHRTGSMSAR